MLCKMCGLFSFKAINLEGLELKVIKLATLGGCCCFSLNVATYGELYETHPVLGFRVQNDMLKYFKTSLIPNEAC